MNAVLHVGATAGSSTQPAEADQATALQQVVRSLAETVLDAQTEA